MVCILRVSEQSSASPRVPDLCRPAVGLQARSACRQQAQQAQHAPRPRGDGVAVTACRRRGETGEAGLRSRGRAHRIAGVRGRAVRSRIVDCAGGPCTHIACVHAARATRVRALCTHGSVWNEVGMPAAGGHVREARASGNNLREHLRKRAAHAISWWPRGHILCHQASSYRTDPWFRCM